MSLYGSAQIAIDSFEIQWIPENDIEKRELPMTEFKETREITQPASQFVLPFDLLERLVVTAIDLQDIELPLSFFRRGRISILEENYIQATYDFYFLLETLFSSGKTKNSAVKSEFKKSTLLMAAINSFLQFPRDHYPSVQFWREMNERFKIYKVDSLVDYIVDKRGFLHHHTSKRKDIWHPSHQDEYRLDAFMYQAVAFAVAHKLTFTRLRQTSRQHRPKT